MSHPTGALPPRGTELRHRAWEIEMILDAWNPFGQVRCIWLEDGARQEHWFDQADLDLLAEQRPLEPQLGSR